MLRANQKITLWIICLLTGCGGTGTKDPAQSKDIGAYFSGSYVYYVDRDVLTRARCPNDVVFVNRVNCNLDVEKVVAWMFYAEMDDRFWGEVKADEKTRNQYVLLINDLDNKILIMLQDAPQQDQSLLPQIRHKEQEIIEVESLIHSLADQVLRLEDELKHEDNPDLRRLMAEQREKLTEQQNRRSQLQKELNDLRKAHLDINNGIITSDNYLRLIKQRDDAAYRLKSAEFSLSKSIEQLGNYMTAMKMLKDSEIWAFSYRDMSTDKVAKVVSVFSEAFSPLRLSSVDLKVREGGYFFRIGLANVRATDLYLRNKNPASVCTGFRLIRHNRPDLVVTGNPVSFDTADHPSALDPLFSEEISGFLQVVPLCSGTYEPSDILGGIKTEKL